MQFNRQACVIGLALVSKHFRHIRKRPLPGLIAAPFLTSGQFEVLQGHLFNIVVITILEELVFCRSVNDHK